MIRFYEALGRGLRNWRPVLWGVVAVAVLLFLAAVFVSAPAGDGPLALGSIALLLWALSLVAVSQAFATPAPALDPGAPVMRRIRVRIARGFRWLMALAATALLGLVILLSYRALGLLLGG